MMKGSPLSLSSRAPFSRSPGGGNTVTRAGNSGLVLSPAFTRLEITTRFCLTDKVAQYTILLTYPASPVSLLA